MGTIDCACGATYQVKSVSDTKRHEATRKHQVGLQSNVEERAITDAIKKSADEDGWDLGAPITTPAYPVTFEELDESDAAKALTPDERTALVSDIALTKGALDEKHNPRMFAERYVERLVIDTPTMNTAIVPDLQTYIEGVVVLLRKDAEGSETPIPYEEDPNTEPSIAHDRKQKKPTAKQKATSAQKGTAAVAKALGGELHSKTCRVCSKDKPLTEYRVKSSRPDGRDTICADCSKQWLINHRAKKAGAK